MTKLKALPVGSKLLFEDQEYIIVESKIFQRDKQITITMPDNFTVYTTKQPTEIKPGIYELVLHYGVQCVKDGMVSFVDDLDGNGMAFRTFAPVQEAESIDEQPLLSITVTM